MFLICLEEALALTEVSWMMNLSRRGPDGLPANMYLLKCRMIYVLPKVVSEPMMQRYIH